MTDNEKFTPPLWKIKSILASTDGEYIIGKSMHDDRPCEVVCTGILNPYDAQLIQAAPNMYKILKIISKLIDFKSDRIFEMKESIDMILDCINSEREIE